MYKQLRFMRRAGGQEKSLATYISFLQHKGILKTYVNKEGYVMYDTEEYEAYKGTVRRGRSAKADAIVVDEEGE